MPAGWARSARGRKELLVLGVFCACQLIIPPIVRELYPFSTPTIVSVDVKEVCTYRVRAPSGRPLPVAEFGLNLENPHDLPVRTFGRHGYGRRNTYGTVDKIGDIATQQEVETMVRERLTHHPELPFVTVVQTVFGATSPKVTGLLRTNSWKIDNPLHQTSEPSPR